MLIIKTSPAGRQKLLSNLYLRNYLYNKYLTIEITMEDKFDKKGDVALNFPLEMHINSGHGHDAEYVIAEDAIGIIKNSIEEQNKYLADFKI